MPSESNTLPIQVEKPTYPVSEVRKLLQSKWESNKDGWDTHLYQELIQDDDLLLRYMKRRRHRIEESVKFISSVLEWHKKEGISELTDQSFPKEFYQANGIFVYGEDADGNAVLYIRVAHTFNPPGITPLLKKFIAYQMLKADRLSSSKRSQCGWVEVLDCSNAGFRNADADLLGYINTTLKNYFPAGQKYILVVNLNWILKAIKTLAFSWFSPAVKRQIKFCSSQEITNFIPNDQLPDYLGGPDTATDYKQIPKDCPSIDEMRKSGKITLDDDSYATAMALLKKVDS